MQWFKDLLDYFIGDEVACEELKRKRKQAAHWWWRKGTEAKGRESGVK